ncbi:MAG TPA: MBG domain-containing protein [Candidatus Angelobacter sp.]|nr:MBG domain-containing protein [Candidatus Angelobacter sp.]
MKAWVLAALLLAFAFVLPSMAQAQGGFVYVNNQSSSNSVSAYKASAAGTLTQITGSPFLTGGVGSSESCYGLSRLAVSSINNLLFVANTGDKSITPFQINTTTGALTKTTGAPFASGLTADTCQGFSIAVTPDGQFLMAASNGQIRTFTVAANGALTFLSSTPNCCSPITGLSISPDGRFLAVSNGTSISMFTISSGVLTPVAGSPFAKLGSGSLSAMDFSCIADSNGNLRLYSGEATTTPTAEGWLVDPNGVLTPTTASPYHSSGTNSNNVLLSPDNTLLFQSNQSSTSINSFVLNPDGSITNSGKFGATGQIHTPVGMSIDQSGTFLYVADDLFGVATFRIGDGGMLAWLQDLGITRPGQIRDVAAFPPRSCATADVVLGVDAPTTAGAGVPIQYTVTVTNNGPATASAVVSDILPAELTSGGSTLIANPSGASRVNTDGTPNVSGTVTITTTVPHQLFPGEKVTVGSVPAPTTPNPIQQGFFLTDPSFNGVVTVDTVPSPTTFTYTQSIPRNQFPAPTLQIVASNGAQRIANTVTITATQVFQLAPGTPITISGVADGSFNGSYTVLSQPTANTFTYQQTGTLPDALSGGGIVTAPINVPATDTAGGGSMSSPACQITLGTGACGTATFSPRPPIVTAIRSGNVVTITTTVPHLMTVGKKVTIQSVANTSFNGTFTITSVPSPTSFTYAQTAANASSSGGLVVAPGLVAQLVTLPNLTQNESRKVLITGTTASSIADGTVVSNRVTISNLSVIDNPAGDTTVSKDVTIGSSGTSVIAVPTATGPYGGTAVVTATLLDGNGVPIVGATVGFNFNQNNSQYNAVTDGSGVATASVPLGFTTVGTHANAFTATFGGDATHTGSSATADLIVTKAVLTVTADNQTRLYGDPNPPLTYTITGFVNSDTIAVVSGTADCSTTATVTSPVGTYPITCTLGTLSATNYDFKFVDGTLTVNPAPLTVNVDNATRAYGDPNPTFTGTIVGIKNGDNITATYSTTATITSFVGTYPITATLSDNGTGALANYTVTINNGTLTITPAALVVTANNAARLYGDPNPPFSGTIAGIKNNDPITATYTSPATETSPVGTYPIIPTLSDNGSGTLVNYTVTANNGSLTVSPAPLTVTAADATRPYGQPNPVFTGTIVGIKNNDPITATYSTTATQTSPAGTYPIVPTVSDGGTGLLSNYSVTLINGTLTITQAVLTVNVANASMIYGDPLPVFTGTITGIVNNDPITATYSTTATSASPVGTYPITATLSDNGTGALANYSVIINNGVLTINPAPLTVNVDSTSRLYGDPNPVFTGSILGIKNADPITAIFSTTADPTSPVGTYPINATLSDGGTGKLTNYTVTINPGTLTINPAPLTVTADNASKLFGTVNPPLNGVIIGIKNADPITATFSTTATATSPVGTYTITPALNDPSGKLGNYTVTSNNGTLTVNPAPTANFLFVNNQAAAGNSINGYSVAVDGTLTGLASSPTLTGGLGANVACSSVNRLALSAGNNLLFVSNGGDQTISAFSIDPTSGALTPAAGSPFASGLTLDACNGISLAATPDGQFLMASSNGQIKTFSIGAGGVLTAVSTASNPAAPNSSMKISANGQFLAVSNGTSVSVYTISGDGSLSPVAGSPFAETGTATLAGLDFSSTSGLLYGAEASTTGAFADAWTVGVNGALSAVTGSPFSDTNLNSNVVLLSPADGFLFASNSGSANVSSYTVGAGGVLTNVVSAGSLHSPVGLATDRSGTLLFVADDAFGVGVFNIGGTGSLTQLNDTAISGAGQVQDLVAYPPRMASNADLSVAISASSANVVAGQNVSFTITLTNNGVDPAAATVTDALPSGFSVVSCSATGNGACIGNTGAATFYLLQSGESQTVTLVTSTSLSIPDGTIANNSVSVTNASAVDANAANNSASVSVTVAQPITTVLTVAATSGTYGGNTSLSATLTDAGNNPIAGKTISFSLNGTAVGSAVTDTFGAASVPASLVGINAGSYPLGVTASFAGDPNNKPSSGSATLTVNPALLTVTAGNASRVYGDANPVFAFSITGFVNGETSAVLTGSPVCTTAADPTSPVGSYPITCTQGTLSAQNYTFTFVAGALTITPAPLTATADSFTRLYGDPNPTLTGTITGIKNGDNITAVYTTAATQTSPVGTYPITVGLVDPTNKLGNYTVTLNNGVLTIAPAPLTVTAANATRGFGQPNPVFTGTIVGIKNGDNITATYSTTATANSPAGTYPIIPTLSDNGTGALANYSVTVVNGTLTITQATLTVTADNASRLYGDPNPVFTGTITGIQNGDNITATYSSVADPTSPVGTYAIVPTLSDNGTGALANYTIVVNNGVLTVNPAPLTVTVDSFSRLYGDPNPVFTGSILGIKNGDAISATFATTADATSPVGTYPIVATLVDPTNKLGNYTVTINNGTLTINPAPLTVSANNASRLFGTPNPPLSGTLTGVKNGDPITASFSTTATATSPVGTYPITPALADPAGKLGNYTVTSNNGTLTVNAAPTANFVFVNNQAASGNSINGYSVAVDGSLTALASSPTLTGGLGANAACSSVNRLALSVGNNLLFVSNGGDQTISAFTIDPASGALTPAAGSPFASGLTLDACSGISLAATPDGNYLMASSNGQIKTFSIGAGGILSAVSTAANSVAPNASMKISANGQFLAVSNGTSVSVYTINADGSLTAVAGSPFAETGTATLAGLDFSSTSGLLYGAEASATSSLADGWTVGANGVLSAVAGSPFSIGAINSNVVLLSPNDGLLFASNQGSANVSLFGVSAGSLSSLGSFGALHAPVGMASDRSGSLLYVADDTFGVGVFRIGAGSLSQLSDSAIGGAGQVQDLVAYPPRMASNADLSVAISASSPSVVAGQNVTYTITLTNNGADPAAATISNVLPAGFTQTSCSATGNGACIGNSGAASFYLLQSGESQTVTLVASISLSVADGTVATDSVSITNASAVDPNAANNSASTNVTVGQPATTSLAVAPASGTYGGSTTLSATLSTTSGALSGKTVSFSLNGTPVGTAVTNASGVASLSTPLGTIGAGLHTGAVSASFAGDPDNKASSGSADLTVNPAPLTVTAANASRAYGDPNPAFTGTITGIQNGDNITATYSTTAVATSPVGTYTIVPALSDNGTGALANYTVTSTNGTLTVNPAQLTVTAANATMVFGDPVPALSGTITGIKNGENITASYSTAATSTSNVGTYPIVPAVSDNGTGVLANYSVSLVNGTLTITPAPLTVTAANASMIYGDAVPALSGTISGIRNGNNITATYSTTATSASPVGTYPIVPTLSDNGTGALANYSVTSNNGTLTINPAPLTVTAASASMIYGDPLPAFSGTITGIKNADNITATYSTVATSASNVGTYAIVPAPSDNGTGALANYTVTLVNGTLTINPAPLSVTADNATRVYGDPNPAFTGTITGLKNGDNITFSATSADPTAAVGTYPIVPVLVDPNGKLVNYTVTATNGTLTVTPAPLTVTAANASMVFGDPVPTLTGTVSGIKNGDNITGVYTTTATSASPVGTYPITASASDNGTGKLTNYTVTLVNATLTINPAPLTVTAANASMVFGDPVPSLSGTITGIKNGNNITATYSTTASSTSPVGTYPIVPAVSDNGTGALANYTLVVNNGTLTINPAPLTVAGTNATMVFGDPVPAVTGTTTGLKNGNTISVTFSTAATSTSPVGNYAIVPSVTDPNNVLSNYTLTVVNGVLQISPAPLTVAGTNAAMIYGDPVPAVTGTITGLKNGDTIGATFSTPATSASPVGNYAVIPTVTDPNNVLGNYTLTVVNGVLQISPAPLTVTAASVSRLYGDPNPVFTGTITGIKNNDNITATYSSATDATTTVGTYPIVPSLSDNGTGALANYTVTSNNGTLTIIPAPLTIQANDATAPVGGPFPTFTGTIAGLKNGDVITASYSTTADNTSPAGQYPIIPSADPNPLLVNYDVTLINGTLTLQ